jgi:hypothetical protein
MKREYNEVYGWMPESIINHLSQVDRMLLFIDWVNREPTEAGKFVATVVVRQMGDEFIEYMFKKVYESLQEDGDVTKEDVIEGVKVLMESFATDPNTLVQFIDYYLDETDSDSEEKTTEESKKKQGRDAKGRFTKKQ